MVGAEKTWWHQCHWDLLVLCPQLLITIAPWIAEREDTLCGVVALQHPNAGLQKGEEGHTLKKHRG